MLIAEAQQSAPAGGRGKTPGGKSQAWQQRQASGACGMGAEVLTSRMAESHVPNGGGKH